MRTILEQLRPGDHTALFYRNRVEQFATAIPYIQIGLERNERCLYIAGDTSVRMVIDAMEASGIDVAREERNGRLVVASPKETYLRHGVFEPQKMIDGLTEQIEISLSKGFAAFRGTGELGWAASLPSALMRLYEYELGFDATMGKSFVALCQYNETIFSEDVLAQMVRVHPKIIARGRLMENPYYVRPEASLTARYPTVTVEQLVSLG